MGRIGCIRWEKLQLDFVARNFALIAPVQYVLHHVSCSYEIIRNELKHCATHKNMSLGFNGVDRVRLLRKLQRDFMARTFALIAPVHPILHRVSCSYVTIPNARKHYETHQNISLGSNGMDRVCSWRKNDNVTLWHELLH